MLRAGSIVLITLLSWQTWAAGAFDFVPSGGGPEKEFQSLISAGNYKQALMAWTQAHSGSNFGRSETGVATYAYLLFQNGMPYTGLQLLVQHTQPAHLNPSLLKLWTTELKNSAYIQKGWIQTLGGWKQIVNNDPVYLRLKTFKDILAAFTRADRLAKEQVNARARIWWQIATQAPELNQVDSSLKALKLMKESGQTLIGQDLVDSTFARVLYQKGDIDAAQKFFAQIPKSSSLYIESIEERAWADLRKNDYDKALGEVTTLMSPALAPLVGPESYFLSNLMSLKVCDYTRLFRTSDLFKKRHRDRLMDIQDLANKGSNKNFVGLMDKFEQGGVSIESAGPLVWSLPRATFRDARFVRSMESRRELLKEASVARELAGSASALGGSAELERFASQAEAQASNFKQNAYARERVLAQAELKEYHVVLNKMHIVEAEVIERMHLDENLKGERSKLAKVEDKGDVLVFPVNSNEVWFDELDNYKARVKDCPTLKGASL
jgi:hypothetical protein